MVKIKWDSYWLDWTIPKKKTKKEEKIMVVKKIGTIFLKPSEDVPKIPSGTTISYPSGYKKGGVSGGRTISDVIRRSSGGGGGSVDSRPQTPLTSIEEKSVTEVAKETKPPAQTTYKTSFQKQVEQQKQFKNIPLRQSQTDFLPKIDTESFLAPAKARYYEAGFSPYQSTIIPQALAEKKAQEFREMGYTESQALLGGAIDVGMQKGLLSAEEAKKIVGGYEKKHILSTMGSYVFGGADETKASYETRKAEEAYLAKTPYSKLIYESPASAVRKFFGDVGTKYFEVTGGQLAKAMGQPLSESQLKSGGKLIGEVALWSFFSPAMKTGGYEEFEEIAGYYKGGGKKTTQQVLGENRFAGLSKLDKQAVGSAVKGKIEKELLSKTSFKEQAKYLENLYKQIKTPEGKAGFRFFVSELTEKQIIKLPVVDIGKGGTIITPKGTQIVFNIKDTLAQIPQMKGVGGITSISTIDLQKAFGVKQIQKQSQFQLEFEATATKQKDLQKAIFGTTSILNQKAILRSGLGQGSLQIAVPKTAQLEKQIFKQPQQFASSLDFGMGKTKMGRLIFPPFLPLGLGFPEFKGKKKKTSRKMFYQSGLASLGLRGTPYGKYFVSAKIPKLYFTGIFTRTIIQPTRRKKTITRRKIGGKKMKRGNWWDNLGI